MAWNFCNVKGFGGVLAWDYVVLRVLGLDLGCGLEWYLKCGLGWYEGLVQLEWE